MFVFPKVTEIEDKVIVNTISSRQLEKIINKFFILHFFFLL